MKAFSHFKFFNEHMRTILDLVIQDNLLKE